jgi:hypothetical protein
MPQSIPSANDDISLNVSHNLKEKNISGEYIDLAQLLQNPHFKVQARFIFCTVPEANDTDCM